MAAYDSAARRIRTAIAMLAVAIVVALPVEAAVIDPTQLAPEASSSFDLPIPTIDAPSMAPSALSNRKIFGPGVNIDSRSNRRVAGGPGLAHRFRAKTTSRARAVLFQPRWGNGYSAGDGGRYRISIRADDGSRNHFPSGRTLASFTWRPGNRGSSGQVRRFTFASPAKLRQGRIYHLVFKNIDSSPSRNYISINEAFTYESLSPRQPRFSGVYAVLNGTGTSGSGGSWSVDPRHTANMDIVYANGQHQGMAYLGAMVQEWARIGGPHMVREHFTISGKNRRVKAACVRVGRQSVSGALTIALERGDGRVIEARRSSKASSVALTSPGRSADTGDWICVGFNKVRLLKKGKTYNLRLSAPSGSQYSMTPIVARDSSTNDKGYHMRSFHFRSGEGQKSSNGGRSWSSMYPYFPQNTQFYLVVK